MSIQRIGFACKWIDRPDQVNGIHPKDDCKKYNTGATTVAWLKRQSESKAEEKLWDLVKQNIEATHQLVKRVGNLEQGLRMVRLSSDILPMYTEPSYSYFYRLADVQNYMAAQFARIGAVARQQDVRLSMHPGQFVVLASDNADIVRRSIEEFEYHVDMARWMGYGAKFQDFKINVHIAGRAGPEGIRAAYQRLSPEARNTLTIENEEITHGLDTCLSLRDLVPLVLDIHHHWCHSGQYIDPSDDRVKMVIDSWRGTRPTMHYSVSREDCLIGHSATQRPDFQTLSESGHKKQKLRAHSDFMWNKAVNDWALSFSPNFDIMVEAKAKNLASRALYEHAKKI
jgi:UV DNA damage endonuclease